MKVIQTVKRTVAASLRAFLADHPDASGALIVYCGDEVRRLGERIVAVPWTLVAG